MRQGTKGIKYIVILLVAILVAGILAVSLIYSDKIYKSQASYDLTSYDLDNKISVDDMTFSTVESNHTATFTGLVSSVDTDTLQTTLSIPSSVTINNVAYTVNRIEQFDSANKPRLHYITALIVPKTVTYIAPAAFEPFVSLQYISVPFVGTNRGDDDNESPFASMFSERQTSIPAAVSHAYPETINGYNNKNNISPWYEGDNISGATEFHYSLPQNLTHVVITDETFLPDRPFFGITSLVSVKFEKVTSLNSIAMFHNCTNLTEVYLPDQVQGLGEYMFGNCYALTEVTIPYGIRELPPYIFTGCDHLEAVIVPSTIEIVSEGAFYQCTELDSIKRYGSNRNLVVSEDDTFDLPNTVTSIGARAFFGCKFKSINMSALTSLKTIGSSAFQACNYITDMSLPFIGYERGNTEAAQDKAMFGYIFGNTGGGTIQAYADGSNAQQAYAIPSSLKSIVITNETYVARGALSNFAYVKTIVLNDEITQISERALEGCTALSDLTVPFAGNYQTDSNLASKYFYKIFGPNSKTGTYNVGGYYVPSLLATFRIKNQRYIYSGTLHSFTSLEVLEISDKTYQMDDQILYNNNKLREITLPFVGWTRGERAISHYTEWWLTQRRKNSVSWIFSLTSSGSEEYLNDTMRYYDSYRVCIPKSLRKIVITDETVIGTWSFRGFRSITDLQITNNPSYIAESCAYDCGNIERLTIPYIGSDSNTNGSTARNYTLGWMFGTSEYTNSYAAYQYGYYYRLPSKLTNVTVNPYTSTVPGYGFANARTITAITLEGAISKVSAHAFENCSSLAHLVAEEATYTTVGDYAFSGCSKVAVLYQENNAASFIPATVREIGAYAFQGTAISSINFDQFTRIGDYAFRNCLEITSVDVPDITHESTLQSFGEGVFEGCAYLTTATIGEGTATTALFRNCTSLRSIDLTGITTQVPDHMFSGCLSLESVTLDDDTTVIGYYSFYNCKALESFLIQSHIREIKDYAFSGCTGLEYMTIPRNVTTIGIHGWDYCNDDFFFYVYDPEADWSKGWKDNWNCSYPVYIIGQADEAMFTYEYFSELKGYLIKGVATGVQLSDQVRLPTKHNGVKIMGLMADALSSQYKMTSVILGEYTRVIGDGALQNGQSMKIYIDVPSTSSQVTAAATENYEAIVGREYDWLSSGIVYYGEYWDYAGTNATMPYLLASKFDVQVDTDYDYYYDGSAHTPDIKSVTIQGVVVDTDGLLNLAKHNSVDVSLFNIEYVDNINASSTDKLAKARLITNATRLNNRNAEYDKLIDKLYMTGTATGTFVVNKKIIDIYPNGGQFTVDYGTGWSNYRWDTNNTDGLEDTNFVLTGHLTTQYDDAGTYKSLGLAGLGAFTNFRWITTPRVYLGGTDVTVNFDFELNTWGGSLDCPYLEVVINPLDVMVEWTGGSWSHDNIFYLWPYTGSPISPTATAVTKSGRTINGIIRAYADVELEEEIPVYPTYSVDNQGVEHIDPNAGPYIAKAVLTSTRNYNLVKKVDDTTYENIDDDSVEYHVKKAVIIIDLYDSEFLIGYNDDYWSKVSTAAQPWVNETTPTYAISGINQGSIFVGELRSANNNKGTHLANSDITWEYQDFKTSTKDAEHLPYYIYREIRTVDGEGPNATVTITRKDENAYYDVIVSGQIYIVYNTFEVKYYVDYVDADHLQTTTISYDGNNTRIDSITYKTEGADHTLIAHVENDGITQDVLLYRYDSSTTSTEPLPFHDLGTYAVGVEAQRKNFDTYYTNIHLEVVKRDIKLGVFDQEYDGEPIDGYSRVLEISNSNYDTLATAQYNSLTFTYYKASDPNMTKAIEAPSAVGDYFVIVYADPSEFYNGINNRKIEFSISKRKIIIDVRDPNNTIGDEIENNNAYAENKVYDSYVYSVVVQLDSTNSHVLASDQLTGVLKTISAIPGVYDAEDTETTYWYWSPQWAVYNKSTKENVTASYEVVLKESFEILNRTIVYESEGDLDAPFDGYPHKITVNVLSPLTGTTIYYTTTPVYREEDEHDIKWSVINPTYTTPGEYIVYFKIVGEYYTTIYDHETVRIVERIIDYDLPDLEIDYDSFDHEFVITVNDPYYAVVEYSDDGEHYTEYPPVFNEMIENYRVYYRITAPNYKTVETYCDVTVTDANLNDIPEGNFLVQNWVGPYDGLAHYPTITFLSGPLTSVNTTIYYRLDEEDAKWTKNLNLTEAGTYYVWVKLFSPGYKVYIEKFSVTINPKTFDGVTVTAFEGDFDRKYHSVTIDGLTQYESYNYTIYYSRDYNSQDSGDGWSTTQIRFKNASVSAIPVYIKISAANFTDAYFSSHIFVKVAQTPPSATPKEACAEFEYQGQPLTTNQVRSIFNTVHDGDIIIKYYLASYDEGNQAYSTTMEKIPYAQELGYYYVEVQFLRSNNCLATSATGYFRIVPRKLYPVYTEEVQYTGYKINPSFAYSIEDPNAEPAQPLPEDEDDDFPIDVDVIIDEDLAITYVLTSAPNDAEEMKELGEYTFTLSLYPNTGNYEIATPVVAVTVIPQQIKIYMRETGEYSVGNPWVKSSEDAPNDRLGGWGNYIVEGQILDGHKLVMRMETSSYEQQTYIYVENPQGAQSNYILVSYDVVQLDELGNVVLDEESNPVSVLQYYEFSFDVRVKIELAALDYEFEDIIIEYDGNLHTPLVTIDDPKVQNARIYYSLDDPDDPETGAHWVTSLPGYRDAYAFPIYLLVLSDNYDPLYASITFEIKMAKLKIEIDEFDEIYSDEDYYVTYTATNSSLVPVTNLPEAYNVLYYPTSKYELSFLEDMYDAEDYFNDDYLNAATCMHDAGEYYVVVLYQSDLNWHMSYGIGKVTLKRRPLHITLAAQNIVKTVNYDGEYQYIYLSGATYQTSDLVTGHRILTTGIHRLRTISANAGTYTAEMLDFADMNIYDEDYKSKNLAMNYYPIVTNEVSIVINKIPFTFTVQGGEFTYTANADKTDAKLAQPIIYDPSYGKPKLYFDNPAHFIYYAVDENNNPIMTECLGIDNVRDVGTYYVIVQFDEGTNYLAYTDSDVAAIVTITPLEVEVIWENKTLQFNNNYQAPKVYYKNILDDDVDLTPVLQKKVSTFDLQGNETITYDFVNSVLLAGSYKAYAEFASGDLLSKNYVLKSSTINSIFKITPVTYTIEVNETSYNRQDVWVKKVYASDLEGFLSGMTLSNEFDGENYARLATKRYAAARYLVSDEINDVEWTYTVIGKDNIDVTNSVVLSAMGYVIIYQDEISVEIDEELLTVTYDTQIHTIEDAIHVMNPSAGYNILYSSDGEHYGTTVPEYINVGEYPIYVSISAYGYNEPVYIERVFKITQAQSVLTLSSTLDRVYSATRINTNTLSITGVYNGTRQDLKFDFYETDENNTLMSNIPLDENPSNVGYYAMRITDTKDGVTANYTTLEKWYYFRITPKTAYLKLEIDQVVTKNQVGQEEYTLVVTNQSPLYMQLCSNDFLDYRIQTASAIKRDTFIINTEFKEGNKDETYYLESTKYLAFKYYIHNTETNPETDNTMNYTLKVTGTVTLRYAYIEYSIPDKQFAFDTYAHYGEITHNYGSDLKQSYTYGTLTDQDITTINFINPGTYTVSYVLKLDGYEDAEGTFKITIGYLQRTRDESIPLEQTKFYDGVTVTTPQYAFVYAAGAKPDNYDESAVICRYQKVGTNGYVNQITEVGNYSYTLIIPASTYYEQTTIVGTYRILAGVIRVEGSYSGENSRFNGNSITYHYTVASQDFTASMKVSNSDNYVALPTGYTVTFDLVTDSPAIGEYKTTQNHLYLRNGFVVRDSNNNDLTNNYSLELDCTITIGAGEMVFDVNDINVEFDQQIHMPTVTMIKPSTYTELYYSLSGNAGSYTTNPIGSPNVGSYTVYLKIVRTNYEDAYATATVTITKATTYLTIPEMGKIYDGNEVLLPSDVVTNTTVDRSKWDISYYQYDEENGWFDMENARPIDVGKYKILVVVPTYDDYGVELSSEFTGASKEVEFEITPVTLVMNWNGTTFTYNGDVQLPSYTISSMVQTSLDVTKVKPSINVYNVQNPAVLVDPIDVGVYVATADITETGNYVIADTYRTTTYSIRQRTIVVSAKQQVIYSGSKFVLNYADANYPYTVSNLCADHIVYNSPLTTTTHVTGLYAATGNTLDNTNLKWVYNDNIDIRDKNFNKVIDNYKVEYNIAFTIDFNSVVSQAEDYYGEYDGFAHTIKVTVDNVSNYTITYAHSPDDTMDPNNPNYDTYVASLNLIYSDTPQRFTDVEKDQFGNIVSRRVRYKINVEGYAEVNGYATVTITPQTAALKLASQNTLSKIYDGENIVDPEVVYNGMEENPRDVSYTYYEYSEETQTYTSTDNTRDVGEYRVEISLSSGSNQNYIGGDITVDFSVVKRDVTIAIYNLNNQVIAQSKVYDGNIMKLNVGNDKVKNLVNGETFIGVVTTKLAVVGNYTQASDFNLTYKVERVVQAQGNNPSILDVSQNYNVKFDLDLRITKATIEYKDDDVEAYFNGYMHRYEVTVLKPADAVVYYWTIDDMTPTTTPYEQKYRGTTTVYYHIVADNYEEVYGNGILSVIGISSEVGDDTPLIYDDTKAYDTKPYMYNADVTLSHPRIVTESQGNQVIKYYKKAYPNTVIATVTYAYDGTLVGGDVESIPTDAGQYLFKITVEPDQEYEAIVVDKAVSFTITKIERAVTWSKLTQTYTGSQIAPTATYVNYAGNTVELDVVTPQTNVNTLGYSVTAVAKSEDTDTSLNYTLTNANATFKITPIEVEELNLQKGRTFRYWEKIAKDTVVYEYDEEGEHVLDDNNEYKYDIFTTYYEIGDVITILDVQGNQYIVDANGNITDVKDSNGDSIYTSEEDYVYTISVLGDGNASRLSTGADLKFVVSLKDPTNCIWKAAQSSSSLITTYTILPFDVDDTTDNYEVMITVPSYVLYTGYEIKPNIKVTLTTSTGITLRDLTTSEYDVTYAQNVAVGKNATVTVTGKGNFDFTQTHNFEIRAEDPERFELIETATVKFVEYVRGVTEAGKTDYKIDATQTSTMDNPDTEIGEETIFLGRLHQSQTLLQVLAQFVRFDTNPELFRVWNAEGVLINANDYKSTPIATGYVIKLYSKSSDDDDNYVDYIRTVLYGDLNGDGKVAVADYGIMKKVVLNMETEENLGIFYLAGLIYDSTSISVATCASFKKYNINTVENDFNANYLVNVEV